MVSGMRKSLLPCRLFASLFAAIAPLCLAASPAAGQTGSVIFLHPDGASSATWTAVRAMHYGPDGDLNWDLLPHVAVYRGHMIDSLTATSNGGATTHATGLKVSSDAFGMSGGEEDKPLVDTAGHDVSVAQQALRAHIPVGLVQSGTAVEPGTAAFVAPADSRKDYAEITAGLVESNAQVMFGGGEEWFLPVGTQGRFGPGKRKDGRNLIDEAKAAGYTIIYTRDELLSLPAETEKVIGIFAKAATFNDLSEEELAAANLPIYNTEAPTIAEMTDVALRILGRSGRQFLLVVEEEGTDNLGNHNNAIGVLMAGKRADDAIGVARRFVQDRPDTLVITAADSDAGGMRMVGIPVDSSKDIAKQIPKHVDARDFNGAPMDGIAGSGTAPFVAAPDRSGRQLPFAIVWAAKDDVSGGILVRAEGLNAHLVRGSFDNTKIAEITRRTLFGTTTPPASAPATPTPTTRPATPQ